MVRPRLPQPPQDQEHSQQYSSGRCVDDVEARLEESADVDVEVVIGCGECLDGTADGLDFPFVRDVVGLVQVEIQMT